MKSPSHPDVDAVKALDVSKILSSQSSIHALWTRGVTLQRVFHRVVSRLDVSQGGYGAGVALSGVKMFRPKMKNKTHVL